MYRRIFAWILAFVMVFSLLPGTALATDETPETEPAATETQETEPQETEPKETEPQETEPKETEPQETEPQETEPQETEPVVTEPVVTEPEETEPQATQPVETQPAPDQKVKFTNPGKRNGSGSEEEQNGTLTISVAFAEDSLLGDADVGDITVEIYDAHPNLDGRLVGELSLTQANGRTASITLPAGIYWPQFCDYEEEGYACEIEEGYVLLNAGEGNTTSRGIKYVKDEAKLTISLSFAEGSALGDEDLGNIVAKIYSDNEYCEEVEQLILTQANGRTASTLLPSGFYFIEFSGYQQEDYICGVEGADVRLFVNDEATVSRELNYVKNEGKLTVSLSFAEDSELSAAQVGDITVRVYEFDEEYSDSEDSTEVGTLTLTQGNGRTDEIILPAGSYQIVFSDEKVEGYAASIDGNRYVDLSAGENESKPYTIRYVNDEAKLTVSLNFAEGSAFGDGDIGDIVIDVYDEDCEELAGQLTLTQENGRSDTITLPAGCYNIAFSGHEKKGYFSGLERGTDVDLVPGCEGTITCELNYVKDEAKLTVSLTFAEGSAFGDGDIGEITAYVYKESSVDEIPVKRLLLTQGEGRTATATLPTGEYVIRFSGYEKDGYFCGLETNEYVYPSAGDEITVSREVDYTKDEAELAVSLSFAEDSDLSDTQVGDITAQVYGYDEEMDELLGKVGELIFTRESGRTASLSLPSGSYKIVFGGEKPEGYVVFFSDDDYNEGETSEGNECIDLYAGIDKSKSYTVRYVKNEAKLTVSLSFAEDSAFGDADIGEITANIYANADEEYLPVKELPLTQENGRTATVTLPAGYYGIVFSGYEKEGYLCGLEGRVGVDLYVGDEEMLSYELNYVKDEAKLTVCLTFDEDSPFGDEDVGDIIATIFERYLDTGGEVAGTVTLTQENDRTASIILPSGDYYIKYSGYEKEGYVCNLETDDEVELYSGTEETASREINYIADEATLTVTLELSESSELSDGDIGDIVADIYGEIDGKPVGRLILTQENGRTASITLPSGCYLIDYTGYEKDGYYCSIDADRFASLYAGEETNAYCWITYNDGESVISVTLNFTNDSALSDADVGDITAQIYYCLDDLLGEEPIGEILLSQTNGRKGQITLQDDPAENGEYALRIIGGEVEGYRAMFTGSDYFISVGEDGNWNVDAKYIEAAHSLTVNVSLSEDSDVSVAQLNGNMSFNLTETVDERVSEYVSHNGSTVFTHTFTNLPTSDHYTLSVNLEGSNPKEELLYSGQVLSFTCTGEIVYEDFEEGMLRFTLDEDCTIDVVLRVKKQNNDFTVIARFTEDSALQAEDFPQGIKLIRTQNGRGNTPRDPAGEFLFSPDTNWTRTVKAFMNDTNFDLQEQPAGYVGTVSLSGLPEQSLGVNPEDCPITVYADICFVERKPYYLDVEFVFADDSALKGAAVGSISLDINDNGTERSFEFSEAAGWHRTLELHGDPNGITNDGEYFGMALSGLAREGYGYFVQTPENSDSAFDWVEDRRTGIPLWDRGETERLVLEVCYTPKSGKLIVDIVNSPYGEHCSSIITVTDEEGNVVVKCSAWDGCEIELPGAGTYTVSQTIEKTSTTYMYFADENKTVEFDPAKGAVVTMLSECRLITNLTVRKYFEAGSALGPEDFPNGVTVTLTEATGVFSGTYTLSDANDWGVELRVPSGSYTATETNADVEGYERTTRFVFAQDSYEVGGGASLRDWGLRGRNAGNTRNSTAYSAVGGPYYLFRDMREFGNQNWIDIYNTYTSIPTDPDRPTGSITINAGDGFYDFDSNEKLDETPDTGNEVDEYTYIVDIDGEEQEITLKPGEEITIDGVAEGAVYTVTPVLPDGYPWNASAEPITGTIGGDTEEDWNAEVSFENDYYYTHEEGVLTIVKTDALTGEKLKDAKFGLYSDKECTKQVAKATTGKDGTCSFDLTEEGTFYIKELKAPEDYYVKSEEVKTVTVKTEWVLETREGTKVLVQKLTASVADLSQKDGGYIWENERKTTDISVTKKFAYDEDLERPESVTIVLYQDGEAYETVKLSAANNWKYVWKDMPLGFEYTVDELNVAKGYYKQIRSSGYDFTVTNSGSILPQTGDMTNIALWGVLALASIASLAVLIYKRKKKA